MSKFLQASSGSEEVDEQEDKVEKLDKAEDKQDKKASKNSKKKEKQKKKKQDDLEQFDEIVGVPVPKDTPTEIIVDEQIKPTPPVEDKEKIEKKKKPKATAEGQPEKKVEKKEKPMNAAAKKALENKKLREEEDQRIKEEEDRLQKEFDEKLRLEEEEESKRKAEEEARRLTKKNKKEQLMSEGKFLTKGQLASLKKTGLQQTQLNIQGVDTQTADTITEKPSNMVRRSKKKKEDDGTNQSNNQQLQQQQQQLQLQEQQQLELSKAKKSEEVDDWESMIVDEPSGSHAQLEDKLNSIQKSPQGAIQKSQSKDVPTIQEEEKDTKRSADYKKIDSGANKELYQVYKQQGELRSPICCILGHVDTGKTTLLDKIRNTNVQEGEAGGITQQIGATFFPSKKLLEELKKTDSFFKVECKLPGLLIIDTPGHESFSNLRTRGSSLCDLAILVIDLMHGLEKQTLESLELLKMRKTPFIIALNKIDRCFEWDKKNMGSSYQQLQKQKTTTQGDYENRRQQIFTQLGEQGFNVAHFWENNDPQNFVSIVPTSGVTGEGIPDLLAVIVKYTSVYLRKKVELKEQLNCTVLELKVIEGHGPTIDCILVDGVLRKDDRIVIQGFHGPIVTKIKAILTPHPMKEMRVKGEYISHDVLYASMGLKVAAHDLEDAVAGSQLYVVPDEESLKTATTLLQNDFDAVKQKIKLANLGVGVAASTLGSLEALLQFLNKSLIPVSYVSVGPVSKDDMMKALKNVIFEDPNKRKKEYACMLVFDVKINAEAREYAEVNQIKIFEANIIYHLFDQFIAHVKSVQDERKKLEGKDAVFPCILKPVAFFNKKDPIIMGVDIEQGVLRPGTPICIFNKDCKDPKDPKYRLKIGIVESIEANKKQIKEARSSTGSVAIRIKNDGSVTAGRQFELTDKLTSIISRHSIDMLKTHFRDEVTLDDWQLVKELKEYFQIQ